MTHEEISMDCQLLSSVLGDTYDTEDAAALVLLTKGDYAHTSACGEPKTLLTATACALARYIRGHAESMETANKLASTFTLLLFMEMGKHKGGTEDE